MSKISKRDRVELMFQACDEITKFSQHGVVTWSLEEDADFDAAGDCDQSLAHYGRFMIRINSTDHPHDSIEDKTIPDHAMCRTVVHECVHVVTSQYSLFFNTVAPMTHKTARKGLFASYTHSDEQTTVRLTDILMPFVWARYQELLTEARTKKKENKKCKTKTKINGRKKSAA